MVARSSWFKSLLGVLLLVGFMVTKPSFATSINLPLNLEHPRLTEAQVSRLDQMALGDVADQAVSLKALKLFAEGNGQLPEGADEVYADIIAVYQADGSLGELPVNGAKWLVIHMTHILQAIEEPPLEVRAVLGNFGSVSRFRDGYYYRPEVVYFDEAYRALLEQVDTLKTSISDAEEDAEAEDVDTSVQVAQLESKATELGQALTDAIGNAFSQAQPFESFSANSEYVSDLLNSWKSAVTEDAVLRAVYAAADVIEQDDKFARNLLVALDQAVLVAKNVLRNSARSPTKSLQLFTLLNSRVNSLLVRYPIAGVKAINSNSGVNVLDVWELGLAALSQSDEQIKALGEELVSQVALLLIDLKGSELADYINTPGMYAVFSAELVAQTYAGADYDLLGLVQQDASNYHVFGAIPFGWSVSNEGKVAAKETLDRVVKSRLYSLIPEFTAQTKAEIHALKRVQYDSPAFLNLNDLASLAAKRLWMITGLSSSEVTAKLSTVFSGVENLNTVVEAAIAEATAEDLAGSKSFWTIPEAGTQTSAVLDTSIANGQGFYVWPMTYNDRIYYSFHARYAHGFNFDTPLALDPGVATRGGYPVTFIIESSNVSPNFFMTADHSYNADAVRRFISKKIGRIEKIFDVVNRLAPEESLALLSDFVEQWSTVTTVIESEEFIEATSQGPGRQAVTASIFAQLFSEILAAGVNKASEAYAGDLAWVTGENRQATLAKEADRVVVFTSLVLQYLNESFREVYISPERTALVRDALSRLDTFMDMQRNPVLTGGADAGPASVQEGGADAGPAVSGLSWDDSDSGTEAVDPNAQSSQSQVVVSLMNETAVSSFDAESIWDQTWRLPLTEHFGNLERITVEVEAAPQSENLRENRSDFRPETREVLQANKSNQGFMDELLNQLDMDRAFVSNPRL